jgi:hypothetical protein
MIAVFAGPSLPAAFRPADPVFDWHPPAIAGDLLALAERPPEAVCLIDGYFDLRPAPWHKEILRLMERGVRVIGGASIGALRAAELDRFGMVGAGAIYRAFRDGRLTGDDEVALVHAPEEMDWAALSVPMVEVRATLVAARRAGLIDAHSARNIRAIAHDVYFAERNWPVIAKASRTPMDQIASLHVPLKRLDALACLDVARIATLSSSAPQTPWTCFMDELARETGGDIQPSR